MITRLLSLLAVASVATIVACGGDDSRSEPAAASATPGVETPDPGRDVINIDMVTDGDGNYFGPVEVTARRGDVLRFVLRSGVHNANFVADSNPGMTRLPASTPMLQIPGQQYDVKVDLAPGRYYYHCDPHALLGMIGYINVTE